MFQSPLKTVAEKLKPTDSKSTVSSLRFERSSDFKKFITFIKDETKELEKIKLPSATEIKPKRGTSGLLGLGALGLFGLLGSAFGGGGENEENLRLGSAGQTTPIQNNLFLTKNIRKTKKNLGLTKSVKKGKSEFKKIKSMFKKLFPKPDKDTLLKMKETRKNSRLRIRRFNKTIKDITEDLNDAQYAKAELLRGGAGLDDPFVAIYDDEIKKLKNFQKKALAMRDFEELKIEANKPIGSFNAEKLKITRQILDDAKVSFVKDGDGGFTAKFGKGSILSDRKFIKTIIEENPKATEFFKKVKGLDPLLFDVPQGGTAFSKILGETRGIKIENRMGIVRESLDDIFTNIGGKTKPLRNFFGSQLKNLGKTKIPGSRLVTFGKGIKFSSILKGGKGLFLPLDVLNLGLEAYDMGFVDLSDGLTKPKIGRNNIITGLYDVFTYFYNSGVEGLGFSDANKRLLIGKPKDEYVTGSLIPFTNIGASKRNRRREKDDYNKKILDARRLKNIFNRSLGDPISGQQNNLLKSVNFIESDSDGAEFSLGLGEPLNSFGLFTEYKLNQK